MKKYTFVIIGLLLIVSFLLGISAGTEFMPFGKIIQIILHPNLFPYEKTILFQLRIPRVWCAFLVGSGLSLSGVILQAILKNPLAESYTIGISGGAAVGVALGIFLNRTFSIPGFAFLGSLLAVFLVLALAGFRKFSPATLLLFGVMLNFIFSAVALLLISFFQRAQFAETAVWFMGDLAGSPAQVLRIAPFFLIPAYAAVFIFWKELNLFSLGEEKARTLGLDIMKKKILWLVLASIIASLCVSLAGIIGFVGLVIPHLTRLLVGADHKKVVAGSFFTGGSFLILADILSRTLIKPFEIPVGVISGFFGGIVFIVLLLKTTGRESW